MSGVNSYVKCCRCLGQVINGKEKHSCQLQTSGVSSGSCRVKNNVIKVQHSSISHSKRIQQQRHQSSSVIISQQRGWFAGSDAGTSRREKKIASNTFFVDCIQRIFLLVRAHHHHHQHTNTALMLSCSQTFIHYYVYIYIIYGSSSVGLTLSSLLSRLSLVTVVADVVRYSKLLLHYYCLCKEEWKWPDFFNHSLLTTVSWPCRL